MPIGPGNLDNIRVLLDYPEKPIFLYSGNGSARMEDCTGGEADKVLAEIEARGAARVGGAEDLITLLSQQQIGRE
jgi:iron complex transport system ATP-binding protein